MKCSELTQAVKSQVFEYLLRLGDDRLIAGHRLSEWCGHAPMLEEDVALANIALDCLGQASNFLHLAGEVEGKERDEDSLAFFRDGREFRNALLVELPNRDFGFTIVKQLLFSAYAVAHLEALRSSSLEEFKALAEKALKEVQYHFRHTAEWFVRLGDGTDESHRRLREAVDELWSYSGELFMSDHVDVSLASEGIAPELPSLAERWRSLLAPVFDMSTVPFPSQDVHMFEGGRRGEHTEHLGHLLAEMQSLARSHPDARW